MQAVNFFFLLFFFSFFNSSERAVPKPPFYICSGPVVRRRTLMNGRSAHIVRSEIIKERYPITEECKLPTLLAVEH